MEAAAEAPDSRVAALETQLDVARSRIENLATRLRGNRDSLRTLQEQNAAMEAMAQAPDAEVAALQDQLGVAQSRIENLSARLRNSRDAARAMRADAARTEANLANARTRIMALQDAMVEARTLSGEEIARLTAQMEEGAASGDEAAATSERLQRLLDNQRDRSARVADTVSGQRAQIRDLENEVRSLRRVAQVAGAQSCQDRMTEIVSENGIQFDNNKSEIRPDAALVINRLVAVARGCEDADITVRGHTDSMGERSYNVYLSELRAAAVVDYMTRNGIPPTRITSVGVGPDEPIADNRTRAGRAQNRRIEILVQ